MNETEHVDQDSQVPSRPETWTDNAPQPAAGLSTRDRLALFSARLSEVMYSAQPLFLLILPFWCVFLSNGGWMGIICLFFVAPCQLLGQALVLGVSVSKARKVGVRRMSTPLTWSYLGYVLSVMAVPLYMGDADDSMTYPSPLEMIGTPDWLYMMISLPLLVGCPIAIILTLFCLSYDPRH